MNFLKSLIIPVATIIVTVASQPPFFTQRNKVLAQSTSPVVQYANNYNYYGTVTSTVFNNYINDIINQQGYITNIAFTPQNGFVIVYSTTLSNGLPQYHFYSSGIPQTANDELNNLILQPLTTINDIQFTPQGGFVILYDEQQPPYISSDTPLALANEIRTLYNQAASEYYSFNRVLFPPQGGVVFSINAENNDFIFSYDVPQSLRQEFQAITNSYLAIESLAFTPQGGLVAVRDSRDSLYWNIPSPLAAQIKNINPYLLIHAIALSPSNDWVLIAN